MLEIVINYTMQRRHASEAAEGKQRSLLPLGMLCIGVDSGWFLMELCESRRNRVCVPGHVCKWKWGRLFFILFSYLSAVLGLSCCTTSLWHEGSFLQHVGSSSLTRD